MSDMQIDNTNIASKIAELFLSCQVLFFLFFFASYQTRFSNKPITAVCVLSSEL